MTEQIFVEPATVIFIQSRAATHHQLIDEYGEMMRSGIQFDPAHGIRDETGQFFVWDGWHRGEAAKQVGCPLWVEVKPGTRQDAEWLALTANQKHGLRRTREDNRRIVQLALRHPYGVQLSNREIARHCGVDDKTVGKIRREMEASAEIPQMESRLITRGGQNYVQAVHNGRDMQTGQPDITPTAELKADTPLPVSETFPLHRPVSQPHGQFDCPRCGYERIVHLNGKAVCLNCATHWPTPADFLAEIGLPAAPQREELQSRFAVILARLDAARLTEVTAWLDDLEERIRGGMKDERQKVLADWLLAVQDAIYVLQTWQGRLEQWQQQGSKAEAAEFREACDRLREAGLWAWAADAAGHGISALAVAVVGEPAVDDDVVD